MDFAVAQFGVVLNVAELYGLFRVKGLKVVYGRHLTAQ